jgi:putative phage-type endonuclease
VKGETLSTTSSTAAAGRKVTPTGVLAASYDTPEADWQELRRTGIGGSDVASLLSMDRYRAPYQLYLEKRGELAEPPMSETLARAARWGHLHEPLLAAEFARIHGFRVRRVGMIRHETDQWRLANLDYRVSGCPDGPCLLELKNRSAWKRDEWGPSGDPDGVPDKEALQTIHYLAVTGYRHAHVGVLINGNDDRYYRVDWDDQLICDVIDMERVFWQRILDADPPPVDGSESVTGLLATLWTSQHEAEKVVDAAAAETLIAGRAGIKEQIAALDADLAAVENQLKEPLGDKELAVAISGDAALYTWKQNGQFSQKRFRAQYPDLADKHTRLITGPDLDVEAVRAEHPDAYRACRARVLRVPGRN